MPIYSIQGPDGKIYEIEGPAGATKAQVVAAIQAKMQVPAPAPAPVAPIIAPPPSTERTAGEAFKDIGASVVGGFGSLLQVPGQLAQLVPGLQGVGQALAKPGEFLEEKGESLKSQGLKVREALRSQAISEAEKEGILSSFATAIIETIKDPALLSTFITGQLPQLLGPAAAAKVGKAVVLSRSGLEGAELAAQAGKIGTRSAIGAGAAMQGADISADAYKQALEAAQKQGMSEEDANAAALLAARKAFALAAPISVVSQALPGGSAIERRLAGVAGKGRVKSALGEAVSEAIEEGGGAFATNVGVLGVDPTRELTQGVGAAAGLGTIGGGILGGVLGKAPAPELPPEVRPGETDRQAAERIQAELLAMKEAAKPPAPGPILDTNNLYNLMAQPNGYALVEQYKQRLAQLPETEETKAAIDEASFIQRRSIIEGLERQPTKAVLTDKTLKQMGFKPKDGIYESLLGKDMASPDQAEEITQTLSSAKAQEGITPAFVGRIDNAINVVNDLQQRIYPKAKEAEDVGQAITPPSGEGVQVAGEPGAGVSTQRPAAPVPGGVVSAVEDAGQPSTGEGAKPAAVAATEAAEPPVPFTPRLQSLTNEEKSLYNFDEALQKAKQPITGFDWETITDLPSPDGRGMTPESLIFNLNGAVEALKTIDGKLRSQNRTGASPKQLIEQWTTASQIQSRIDQSKQENPELWSNYEQRQQQLQSLKVGDDVQLPNGEVGKLDAKFAKNWRVVFPEPTESKLGGEKTLLPASALRPAPVAPQAAETPVTDIPAQIANLKAEQDKLLTGAKKVPAPRSKARKQYDALAQQIADLEAKQAGVVEEETTKTVRVAKPRKPPATIMGSSLLAMINRRLGGIDTSLLSEVSTKTLTKRKDKNGRFLTAWRNPLVPEGTLFRPGGVSDYSQLAEILEEEGYLEPGSVEADYKGAGERAKDLVKAALSREEVLTIDETIQKRRQAEEDNARLQQEEEERQAAEIQAARDEAAEEVGLTPEDMNSLSDEDIELFPTENQSDEAFAAGLRGMGFDEQEIADEIRAKQERERAAQTAKGRPQEAGPAREAGEAVEEGLTAQTEEELRAKAEREQTGVEQERKSKAAEQERLRKEQLDKEEKARADESLKDFELGKSAEEQMTGMGDLFGKKSLVEMRKRYEAGRAAPAPVETKPEPTELDKEIQAKIEELGRVLSRILGKFGLKDVALNLVEDMKAEGEYAQSVIRLALDAVSPVQALRHESIHALKELGFFTPQQWAVLEKQAQSKWVDQYLKNVNINKEPLGEGEKSRYDAYMDLYKGDMDAIIEEAIADAFGDFDVNKAPPGLMQAILNRLRNFFDAVKTAFGGEITAEQVFRKVEKGELGKVTAAGSQSITKESLRIMRGEERPDLGKNVTVDKVGKYFDDQIIQEFGGKLDYKNPQHLERAIQQATEEVQYQIKQKNSGLDWYEEDIQKAFKDTIKVLPELKKEDNRILFSVMAGMMSPETNARDNWFIASKAFEHYVKTGDIPGVNPENGNLWMGGTQSANKKIQLEFLDRMVKDLGVKKTVKWLMSPQTVKDINQYRAKYGNLKSGINGKATDLKPNGLFAFGEKIGPFISNINGIHDVTVDKWFIRTFNRYFGTMIGPDGKIVNAPTEPERRVVKELANRVAANAGIKNYQVQSLLWFYEQRLFTELGASSPSYGFSDGARKFLDARGKGAVPAGAVPAKQAGAGGVKPSLRAPQTEAFKKWFGDSKIVNPDGTPKVMYHGTARDITEFRPKQAGAIFVTDNPDFAEMFADASNDWIARHYKDFLSADQIKAAKSNVPRILKEMGYRGDEAASYKKQIEMDSPFGGALDVWITALKEQLPTGPNVMPLYVRAEKPFDFENPEHIKAIQKLSRYELPLNEFREGSWRLIEMPRMQELIKEAGFDGFYVKEGGVKNLAVYKPEQLKSATGNIGTFDITKPDIRYSLRDSIGLYSELENKVAQGPNKAPAASWKAYINGLTQKGVKPEEIEWSGVRDWLDLQTGPVSKDAVNAYLKQGGVKVEEVVLGGRAPWRERLDLLENRGFRNLNADEREELNNLRERFDEEGPTPEPEEAQAKYGQYTLPGGENYREVLLTLPTQFQQQAKQLEPEIRALGITEDMGDISLRTLRDAGASEDLQRRFDKAMTSISKEYRSTHWEQPNVIAHIRLNDRTDADGNKVLFVEEIQSDWGQEGKKKGFVGDLIPQNTNWQAVDTLDTVSTRAEAEAKLEELQPFLERNREPGMESRLVIREGDGFFDIVEESRSPTATAPRRYGISRAPFVTKTEGWLNLALKRIMVMAAEGGYDKVAFVDGAQSARRYDLSKQVTKIEYASRDSAIQDERAFTVYGLQGEELISRNVAEKELPDLIGKEATERLLAAEPKSLGGRAKFHVISGDGLKVGGEGMNAFYNQIVPIAVKKLLPKVGGGKMEDVNLLKDSFKKYDKELMKDDLKALGEEGFRAKYAHDKQPGFTVTPEMKQKVETTGLPRFSLRSTIPTATRQRIVQTTVARDEKTFYQRIIEAISPNSFQSFRADALNRYDQLSVYDKKLAQKMGGKALLASSSAESAALFSDLGAGLTASALGVHDRMGGVPVYRNGVTIISNKNGTVKGPTAIFAPLARQPGDYQAYQYWAAVKRGLRFIYTIDPKTGQPIEKLITAADGPIAEALRKQYLRDFQIDFDVIQKEWIKYNDGLVDYMLATGVLSKERADIYKQYADYLPFYRQMDGVETVGPKIFQSISGIKPPKKLKGGEAPIDDFLENIVRNTQSAIQAGIKNIAAQRAADVAVKIQMADRLDYHSTAPNVFHVYENGKPVSYVTQDQLFINAVKSLGLPDLPFIGIFSGPANLLRNLVTKDPGFMLANLMRDSMSAWVTSGVKMTPMVDTISNFGAAIAGKSPEFQALMNSGILGGYEFSQNVEQSGREFGKALRKQAKVKQPGMKGVLEMGAKPFTSLWEALEKGSTASDAATRMEVYKRTLAETGNEAEALYRALEVMNFNRKGSSAVVRVLTAAVPFLNARMQGLDVLYRAATGKMNVADAKQVQRNFFIRGATIAALSTLYWAMTHDDDEYKKQEQETRDNYWLLPSLGVKIPIPFEIGVLFKVIPERILGYTMGSDTGEDFLKSMARQLTSTLAFNPIPQTVLPVVESMTNFSFFTMRPVVGQGLEGLQPAYQVGPSTSRIAEKIGAATKSLPTELQISPAKLDNLINGYTGTMGMYMVNLMDAIFDMNTDSPKPSKRFEQMPLIRRFAIDPEARGSVTAYYELKNSVDAIVRTSNMLERTMNYEELPGYLRDNARMLASKDYILDLEKTMKEFREMKILVRSAKMEADAKRDSIASIEKMENQLTANIQYLKSLAKGG